MTTRVGVVGRRTCALLAACSAVLHGISLGHVTNVAATVLIAAMLAGCLYCARDLWLHGTQRGWLLVALMNFAMIAIHLPASSGHHHGVGLAAAAPMPEATPLTRTTFPSNVEESIIIVKPFDPSSPVIRQRPCGVGTSRRVDRRSARRG